MDKNNFEILGFSKSTLNAIKSKGFEEPTEIQAKVIPTILTTNLDLIICATTWFQKLSKWCNGLSISP